VGRVASLVLHATIVLLLCPPALNGCFQGAPALAGADELFTRVTIATDSRVYRTDQPIHVTIRNDLDTIVYLRPANTPCGVAIYRRADGQWIPTDICLSSTSRLTRHIAPGGILTSALGVTTRAEVRGPVVGKPITPGVSDRDLRTLPVQPPAPPGSVRERTQGILEPGSEPGSGMGFLPPGTYRLELTVTIGTPTGRQEVIRSEEFVVQ
jgi:hypothetical protein